MRTISIVICTYNRCEILKDTLENILNQYQDGNFSFEVILVNNNSRDKTKGVADSCISMFEGRLKYIFELQQGVSFARNRGINESKGEIIAFTDDDVIVEKDWIFQINDIFKNQKVDLILGESSYINEFNEKCHFQRPMDDIVTGNGLNLALKKDSLKDIGLFDTNLGPGAIGCACEDLDFVYRFIKKGKKVIFSEKPKVIHRPRLDFNQAMKFYYRDNTGVAFCSVKHIIKNHDFYMAKRLYWIIKSLISDYFLSIMKNNKKIRRKKQIQILGILKGIIIGVFFYLFGIKLRRPNRMQNNKLRNGKARSLLKVAYVHGNSNILAGQEFTLIKIIKNLDPKKYEALLFLPGKGIFSDFANDNGIQVSFVKLSRFRKKNPFPFFNTVIKLFYLIKKEKIKLIHSSGLYPNQYCSIATKLAKIPCLCYLHSTIYNKNEIKNSLLKLSDCTVGVSKGVGDKIKGFGIKESKIKVIYNGFNFNDYKIDDFEVNKIRESLGIEKNLKIVGQIGQIIERKGILFFIKMAEVLTKQIRGIRFLLVGDDKNEPGYLNEMKSMAKELSLDNYIIFTGFQENTAKFIKLMDVVVLHSLIEGLPGVLIESMLLEKPVVATDIAGTDEVIEDNVTGILVPVKDYNSMANGVLRLLNNKDYADKLVKNARNKALTEFSIEKQMNKISVVYDELTNNIKPRY